MIFVGIDPGQTGAICAIRHDGLTLDLQSFDKGLVAALDGFFIRNPVPMFVCLENVHSMPKQGVASTFKFGVGFGIIQGYLAARKIPHTLVNPQQWTKICRDHVGETAKERTLSFADDMWGLDIFIQQRCRKPHAGLMDAAVIAYWGMLVANGKLG